MGKIQPIVATQSSNGGWTTQMKTPGEDRLNAVAVSRPSKQTKVPLLAGEEFTFVMNGQ